MQVDFPLPEGPTRATVSPAPTSRLKPSGNFSDPYTCAGTHVQRHACAYIPRTSRTYIVDTHTRAHTHTHGRKAAAAAVVSIYASTLNGAKKTLQHMHVQERWRRVG